MKSYNPACVSNKFGNVKHYFWIDYFRFIAALIVCLVHVRAYLFVNFSQIRLEDQTLINKIWFFVTRLGVESVVVFFAFLIVRYSNTITSSPYASRLVALPYSFLIVRYSNPISSSPYVPRVVVFPYSTL